MSDNRDIKHELTESLRELQLPVIRRCFEEKARQAERESLSYRIDSSLLLPARNRCLMKMLPVLFEWDKRQIEEAIEFGNQTRIDRSYCGAVSRSWASREKDHSR